MYFAGVLFAPKVTYAAGLHPDAIAVGDMNGDGKPDLVTANFGDGTATLLLNNGNGTFTTFSTLTVDNGPESVAIADLNGDGHEDIVVANAGIVASDKTSAPGNTLSILFGNGDGTFQPKVDIPSPGGPQCVIVADVNGDGHPDLITADRFNNTVSILLGNGDGTFRPDPFSPFPVGKFPAAVAAGDLNLDGKVDLAVANNGESSVSVLMGNGDGSFQPAKFFSVAKAPRAIAIANVTADAFPDIVTAGFTSNVTLLPGLGTGSFGPPVNVVIGQLPFSVAVGDLNNDGRPDIVTANQHDNRVGIVVRSPLTDAFQSRQNFPAGAGPEAVVLGDFNGDGRLDIATANFDFNNVGILLNTLQPTVTTVVTSQNPTPAGAAVQFTAVIRQDPAFAPINGVPRGLVQFLDNGVFLANVEVRTDGTAAVIRSNLAVGVHVITARYIGNNLFAFSSAATPVTQVITPPLQNQGFVQPIINGVAVPVKFTTGGRGQARIILQNQGDTAVSGELGVQLFLSTDTTLSADDVSLPASIGDFTSRLNPKQSGSFLDTFTLPAGVTPGPYFLLAQLVIVSGFTPAEVSSTPAVSAPTLKVV